MGIPILVFFCFMIFDSLRGNLPGCEENKQFYQNSLHNKIFECETDSFKWYKNISYYFHLDDQRHTIIFINAAATSDLVGKLEVGDSIVKYSDTRDFELFRSGKLIYKYQAYECTCPYCH